MNTDDAALENLARETAGLMSLLVDYDTKTILSALHQVRDAAAEDTKRLDWLEKRSVQTDWGDEDGSDDREVYELYGGRNDREWVLKGIGKTLRAAIDAAMSAGKGDK